MPGGGQAARRSLVETSKDRQLDRARQSAEPGSQAQSGISQTRGSRSPAQPASQAEPDSQARARQRARQTQTVSEPGRLRQSQTASQTDPSVSHQLLSVVRVTRCKGPCTSCLSFGCRLLG